MSRLIYAIVIVLTALLSACASNTQADENSRVNASLNATATSINQSLFVLDRTQHAATPPQDISAPPAPSTYGMQMLASVNWEGPIEPLVRRVCHATHYRLRVMGSEPAIPILVSVHMHSVPIAYILESAGYQADKRARVVVYPSLQTVDLQYISE